MTNIAFIGLGIMGSPMAVHLAKAGHDVIGYNRTPDKAKPLVDAGGTGRRLGRRGRRRRRRRQHHGARLARTSARSSPARAASSPTPSPAR